MSLLGWAIGLAALDEMEEGEQARREIKEQRWKLEEERRQNRLNEQRIRKLEDELRRLKGGGCLGEYLAALATCR